MRTSPLASRIILSSLLMVILLAPAPVTLAQEEATGEPTAPPTEISTEVPTEVATEIPTEAPTEPPTELPTDVPTELPAEPPTTTTEPTAEASPTSEATVEATLPSELTAEVTLETLLAPAPLVARVEPVTEAGLMAAMVFVVNSANDADDGACNVTHCSLREAINAANANLGKDTINFNIPGTGPHTITPAIGLPGITEAVIINGTSEPYYTWATPRIVLNGAFAGAYHALNLGASSGSTIKGLVINSGWNYGINMEGANNLIQANFIGTNAAGTAAEGNSSGILLWGAGATNNTIGGATAALRNVISGSYFNHGVIITVGANGNRIQGNYIGTDKTGTVDLGNDDYGVVIDGSPNNIVGGTVAGARNVISGNTLFGVYVYNGATGNVIAGNYIGTNAAGTVALGNTSDGIAIVNFTPAGNTVGGTTAYTRNVISGNGGHGVSINGNANVILGNFIGTNASGGGPLNNGSSGVYVTNGIGNIVGGSPTGAGNRIAFNTGDGITVANGLSTRMLNNLIYNNIGLAIDLNGDGVTLNDDDDTDPGANGWQNFPALTDMRGSRFTGTLNSDPGDGFRLQFYASPPNYPACNLTGYGEGQRYLGTAVVLTDSGGDASFNLTLPNVTVTTGWWVSATATDLSGNTSEFSRGAIANLGIPVLTGPANSAITNLAQPTFTWNPVPNAEAYWIQIAYDPGFLLLAAEGDPNGNSFTPSPLAPSETYYWRVATFGPGYLFPFIVGQVTPWSATRRINILPY